MFAVIKTGGKQYRVAANDLLKIEKVSGEVGDIVEVGQVLAHGEGENVVIGAPFVDGATVTGQADRWRLPPAPASLPAQLRAARADAVRTLGAAAQAAQCP